MDTGEGNMDNEQQGHRPPMRSSGGWLQRFNKAYGRAREWHCSPLRASIVGVRFALWRDSGRFASHGGWRVSRISQGDHDAWAEG